MTYVQSCDVIRRCAFKALASATAADILAHGPAAAIESVRCAALRSGDGRVVTAISVADRGPLCAARVYCNAIEDADFVI